MKKCSSNQSTGRRSAQTQSRVRSNSRRRKNSRMKTYYMILFYIVLSLGILGTYNVFSSDASVVYAEENLSDIQYKVIEIQYGDTLTSIANENMGPGYTDIDEYMDEIMLCNNLTDKDYLIAGANLMIPYYTVIQE